MKLHFASSCKQMKIQVLMPAVNNRFVRRMRGEGNHFTQLSTLVFLIMSSIFGEEGSLP